MDNVKEEMQEVMESLMEDISVQAPEVTAIHIEGLNGSEELLETQKQWAEEETAHA